MATTARPTLFLFLLALLALLAHGSPLAAPSARLLLPRGALAPAAAAAAQATPTTAPRLPYPIPDTYNGTAFRRPGTGGLAPATGAATGTGGRPARVTPAPTGGARGRTNGTVAAAAQKDIPFIQTTYWSCVQWPTTVHCGWHEPILAVGDAAVAAAAAPAGPTGRDAAPAAARRAFTVAAAALLSGVVLGFV